MWPTKCPCSLNSVETIEPGPAGSAQGDGKRDDATIISFSEKGIWEWEHTLRAVDYRAVCRDSPECPGGITKSD